MLTRKKNCHLVDFVISVKHRIKIKENIDKYVALARELKKAVEQEGDSDSNCCWCTWNGPQKLRIKNEEIGNQRKNWDHPDHCIVKIG